MLLFPLLREILLCFLFWTCLVIHCSTHSALYSPFFFVFSKIKRRYSINYSDALSFRLSYPVPSQSVGKTSLCCIAHTKLFSRFLLCTHISNSKINLLKSITKCINKTKIRNQYITFNVCYKINAC